MQNLTMPAQVHQVHPSGIRGRRQSLPINGQNIDITFTDVSAMGNGVLNENNYTISGVGQGAVASHPASVSLISGKTYRLIWNSGEMVDNQSITMEVSDVYDAAGNKIIDSSMASGTAVPVSLNEFIIE